MLSLPDLEGGYSCVAMEIRCDEMENVIGIGRGTQPCGNYGLAVRPKAIL